MAATTPCPVCGLALDSTERIFDKDALVLQCQRCGVFGVTGTMLGTGFGGASSAERAGLMAALRDATDQGHQDQMIVLTSDNWKQVAASFSSYSIDQKIRRLLEYVGNASKGHAGAQVPIKDQLDYPRFAARDVGEYNWLRRVLLEQRLVEANGESLVLTIKGWEAYRPGQGGAPGTCFVAMASDPSLDAAYSDGIKPSVVTDCGFTIVRVDRVEHNDNINDRIIAEIRGCQFLVADFTLHRNGVYFEAGLPVGLAGL